MPRWNPGIEDTPTIPGSPHDMQNETRTFGNAMGISLPGVLGLRVIRMTDTPQPPACCGDVANGG